MMTGFGKQQISILFISMSLLSVLVGGIYSIKLGFTNTLMVNEAEMKLNEAKTSGNTNLSVQVKTTTHSNITGVHKAITKVLLLSYYRGGSSFGGQMFGQNPRAFYWFEPLDSDVITKKKGVTLVDTDFQLLHNNSIGALPHSMLKHRTSTLAKTFNCGAVRFDWRTLSGKFFRNGQGAPRFGSYLSCLRTTKQNFENCSRVLQRTCLNSELVAAKVIRYPMYEVPELIKSIPELKVIHLIRDPRGTIMSRAKIHSLFGSKLAIHARNLCNKLAKNNAIFTKLQSQVPENYMRVKYEDLSLNPEETMEGIYKFLGERVPENLYTWINKNTKAKVGDWQYGTRRNAKEVVYRWRKTLTGRDLLIVTENCRSIINLLGYTE